MNNIIQHDFIIGPTDTDSISFSKKDMLPFSEEEIKHLVNEINGISPEFMIWANDGYYDKCLILAAKNYVLIKPNGQKICKGSSIKDNKKEKTLRKFIDEIIELFLNEKNSEINELYLKYCKECFNLTDMTLWCKKVTLTDKIFRCRGHEKMTKEEKKEKKIRANEYKVLDALKGRLYQEGDKVYVFYNKDGTLSLLEDFDGKSYDEFKLVGKIHSSLKTFSALLDLSQFEKYHNKTKRKILLEILDQK